MVDMGGGGCGCYRQLSATEKTDSAWQHLQRWIRLVSQDAEIEPAALEQSFRELRVSVRCLGQRLRDEGHETGKRGLAYV